MNQGSEEQSIDFDLEVDSASETESYFDADDAMSVDGVDICILSNLKLGDKASQKTIIKIKLAVKSKQEHHAIVYRDI